MKMKNLMKLWDLIVWNQGFRKIKNILYVINKKIIFLRIYKRELLLSILY